MMMMMMIDRSSLQRKTEKIVMVFELLVNNKILGYFTSSCQKCGSNFILYYLIQNGIFVKYFYTIRIKFLWASLLYHYLIKLKYLTKIIMNN